MTPTIARQANDAGRIAWLGAVYPASAAPEGLLPFAQRAQRLRLGQLWVIEDCFLSAGITLAASALAATRELQIGIGLLPIPLRNPALAAMELTTIARLHPHRLTAAFGHGVRSWMRQAGAQPPARLQALEEYLTAVRTLLAGHEVSTEGSYINLDRVQLAMPAENPPSLLVGSTGPRGIDIGHRAADGILLPEGSTPDFIQWATSRGNRREARCAIYAWLSVDDDPEQAIDRVLPAVKHWAASEHYPHPRKHAGLEGPPVALDEQQLRELAPAVAIAGTPDMCAQTLTRMRQAGATDILLMPQGDVPIELERLVSEIVPLLPAAAR